jgi:oligoendopeptidase F
MKDLKTASWDNTNIYKDLQDPKIEIDLKIIARNMQTIDSKKSLYKEIIVFLEKNQTDELYNNMELTKELYRLYLDTNILLDKISTFASTVTSVNTLNYEAKALSAKVNKLSVDFTKAFKPIQICVLRSPVDYYAAFLDDPRTRELAFELTNDRKQLDHLLSVNEEVLLTGFGLDGLSAWGKLYSDISGAMKVNVDGEIMGLASANNFATNPNRLKREKAYRAINEGWKQNEISACAILNSINGWRNENCKVRSTKKELHYLDQTCQSSNITRDTLDALMKTTYDKRAVGQEAIMLMARELKLDKLGPWDLMAPKPESTLTEKISYPEAIVIIKEAFGEVNSEMADFAQMMMDKNWIDCADSENRTQGAYCTGFANTREPRVFMTLPWPTRSGMRTTLGL